jgi:hypothetical protein
MNFSWYLGLFLSRIVRLAALAASAVFLVVCLVYAGANAVFVYRYWFRMAHLDQTHWEVAYLAHGLWYTLTHQFNEHRVVLLSLFTYLDWKLVKGSMSLLQSISVACQAATYVWLFAPLLGSGLPRPALAMLGGVVAVWATWLGQCENLCWPVQFPVFLCNLCGVAAAWHTARRLTRHSDEPTWGQALRAAGPSAAWATLATFNYANGVLTWIPLAFIAMARRRWRLGATYLGLMAATLGIYLIGYKAPTHHVSPFHSLVTRPLDVATFLLVTMARPLLPAWMSETLEGRLGFLSVYNVLWVWLAGATVIAIFAWWLVRQVVVRQPTFEELFYLPVAMMMFGTALVTAMGRLGFGLGGALASRYGTIELVLYFCLLAMVTCAFFRAQPSAASTCAWGGAMAALVAASWPAGQDFGAFCRERAHQMRLMTYALRMNVLNPEQARYLIAAPLDVYKTALDHKRANGIGVFIDKSIDPIGGTISATGFAAKCEGAVEAASPVSTESGTSLFIRGWAWNQFADRDIEEFVLVEPGTNTIVGVGVGGSLRGDKARRQFTSGWFAYSQPRSKHAPYTVAGRIGDNRYCTIGTVLPPN